MIRSGLGKAMYTNSDRLSGFCCSWLSIYSYTYHPLSLTHSPDPLCTLSCVFPLLSICVCAMELGSTHFSIQYRAEKRPSREKEKRFEVCFELLNLEASACESGGARCGGAINSVFETLTRDKCNRVALHKTLEIHGSPLNEWTVQCAVCDRHATASYLAR